MLRGLKFKFEAHMVTYIIASKATQPFLPEVSADSTGNTF